MWFQIQLDDGFLGVWHWELANGARVYTDGCWAGTDGSDPVPVVDFHTDVDVDRGRRRARPLRRARRRRSPACSGTSAFTLEGGRAITVEAEGTFARPYEPFQRGGLNLMQVRDRRRPDRHRDLRGHRRPPPPILPRDDREWDAAGMSGGA